MPEATKPTTRKGGRKSSKSSRKRKAAPGAPAVSARRSGVAETPHKQKPVPGKGAKGAGFDAGRLPTPDVAELAAVAARPKPFPPHTRYPVDMETFAAMKRKAEQSKAKVAKPGATVTTDESRKGGPAKLSAGAVLEAGVPLSAAAAPVLLNSFAGIPWTGIGPPDCTLAVGPSHVLASVNASLAIYNKAGGAQLKLVTLATWFQNVITGTFIFDPRVLYDQHAGRWVVLAVARGPASRDTWFLISVSKTGDPLGGWWNYKLDAKKSGSIEYNHWADYPALGVDNQAVYVTANMFNLPTIPFEETYFKYSLLRIFPKARLYAGGPPNYFDFFGLRNVEPNRSLAFTLQPCHTYGAPGVQYFVNSFFPPEQGTENRFGRWALYDPTTSPRLYGIAITTAKYSLPPDAPQKGGGRPLDTGDTRILNAVFRGGSVWCGLTTGHNFGSGNRAACHWLQINVPTGFIAQQGIYGSRDLHHFYAALAPDSNGNMVMVFCRSGAGEYASIRYTGRRATDALGKLQDSALLRAGVANYQNTDSFGRNRWGDYAGVANDPSDPLRTWFYSLYPVSSGQWGTHVGSSKF